MKRNMSLQASYIRFHSVCTVQFFPFLFCFWSWSQRGWYRFGSGVTCLPVTWAGCFRRQAVGQWSVSSFWQNSPFRHYSLLSVAAHLTPADINAKENETSIIEKNLLHFQIHFRNLRIEIFPCIITVTLLFMWYNVSITFHIIWLVITCWMDTVSCLMSPPTSSIWTDSCCNCCCRAESSASCWAFRSSSDWWELGSALAAAAICWAAFSGS